MKKRPLIVAAVLGVIFLVGWTINHYCYPKAPPKVPFQEPVTPIKPSSAEITPKKEMEQRPAAIQPTKPTVNRPSTGSLRLAPTKQINSDEGVPDLSEHSMSIKREENKGYKIMPGVNVKSGVVHVQLDQNSEKSVEIEKDPDNSNSDYQVLMKKKF